MEEISDQELYISQCLKNGCECCAYVSIKEKGVCDACHHKDDEHGDTSDSVAKKIYKTMFGFDEVRPNHDQAVSLAVEGRSIVLLLPTGHGKSYCFWAPVLLTEGVAIIVEPLLSLISDQLMRLNKKYLAKVGYEAVAITGEGQKSPGPYDIKQADLFKRLSQPGNGKQIKFIYMTAEKLSNWISSKKFERLTKLIKINRVIFDEAFVLSQWSEFRPEHYQTLKSITASFPYIPYTLATACMTPATLQTLTKNLNLAPSVIIGDLSRPNLFINVRKKRVEKINKKKEDAISDLRDLVDLINKYKNDFGIIYCSSKAQCDKLLDNLIDLGVKKVDKYYGTGNTRSKSQRTSAENIAAMSKWHRGEIKCMIATTAFGMGIDKPNVRYVVHWTMAESGLSYYQQIGRAGRDGLPSECLLYYHVTQKTTIQKIKEGNASAERDVRNMLRYARNNYLCRHVQISILIGQPKLEPCRKMCDVCLRPGGVPPLEYVDYADYARDICTLIWSVKQAGQRVTLSELSRMFCKTVQNGVMRNDELKAQWQEVREKYAYLKDYNHELLIELVIRGYLRDKVSKDASNIVAYLKVDDKPTPDKVYQFLVPKPLDEVRIEMPGPVSYKRGLKRKREFQDSFFNEKVDVVMNEVSSDEEGFTKETWKVEKFLDRHNDYAVPHLLVQWQTGETTWEPEQEIRKNCGKLYREFRAECESKGEWAPEPPIFEPDFYSS